MSNTKTLHGLRSKEHISLESAITRCKEHFDNNAIALLYSPTACQLAKLVEGKLTGADGEVITLEPVFEARIFNQTSELRWLNVVNGTGHAVLISESNILGIFDAACDLPYFETLPQQYILWGQGMTTEEEKISDGWSRLGAARIGAMDIPIAGINRNEQRVILKATEYLQEVDDYGNVAVVEERLTELKILINK
jgi:CRISPR-associated protein (TIGR03984 family)